MAWFTWGSVQTGSQLSAVALRLAKIPDFRGLGCFAHLRFHADSWLGEDFVQKDS